MPFVSGMTPGSLRAGQNYTRVLRLAQHLGPTGKILEGLDLVTKKGAEKKSELG
jgi:hypothetical protein